MSELCSAAQIPRCPRNAVQSWFHGYFRKQLFFHLENSKNTSGWPPQLGVWLLEETQLAPCAAGASVLPWDDPWQVFALPKVHPQPSSHQPGHSLGTGMACSTDPWTGQWQAGDAVPHWGPELKEAARVVALAKCLISLGLHFLLPRGQAHRVGSHTWHGGSTLPRQQLLSPLTIHRQKMTDHWWQSRDSARALESSRLAGSAHRNHEAPASRLGRGGWEPKELLPQTENFSSKPHMGQRHPPLKSKAPRTAEVVGTRASH